MNSALDLVSLASKEIYFILAEVVGNRCVIKVLLKSRKLLFESFGLVLSNWHVIILWHVDHAHTTLTTRRVLVNWNDCKLVICIGPLRIENEVKLILQVLELFPVLLDPRLDLLAVIVQTVPLLDGFLNMLLRL